jgi:hypothetical protein
MSPTRRRVATLLAAMGLAVGTVAVTAPAANAATAASLKVLVFTNDQFYNYDFTSESASSTNVDWAVSLLFYNNAEIDYIKTVLSNNGAPYGAGGGTKHGRLLDTPASWSWDGDGGRKTAACSFAGQHTNHYRIYADSDDRIGYTPNLGYWVFGSTHIDYQECTTGDFYDNSEVTEADVAKWAHYNGATTSSDYANFYNAQYNAQGNHYWYNDGYATYIKV